MIQYRDLLGDTICSPITPPGYSGVAVIRVSGDQSFSNTLSIIKDQDLKVESHKAYFTQILDEKKEVIDQVLVTFFEKGKSFTGDESVEISCHGNPLIVNAIINRFLAMGCRSAERGEFSFRAYYNGKLDLVQAEAIHDLVTAKIQKGSKNSLDLLTGELSEIFQSLESGLVNAMAHLEATIDFVEQDIDTDDFKSVEKLVENLNKEVDKLLVSYDIGKNLRKDPKILILGSTNVGKSSLFNQFVQSERAIVTDIAGTTRDIVSEHRFIGNSSVQFLDSAGLRETQDHVESIGIEKSLSQVEDADLVLVVIDCSHPEFMEKLHSLPKEKVLVVFNKIDLLDSSDDAISLGKGLLKKWDFNIDDEKVVFSSSKNGAGIPELLEKIETQLTVENTDDEGVVITQARHFNHLSELKKYMNQALALLSTEESPDLISQELQLGLSEIHQLLGKEYDDEVLDKIFSEFCIGK